MKGLPERGVLWWLTGVHACVGARLGVALATAPAEAQGASPHTLEKEKPSQGRENRLTAKSAYVGMLRIFRQLRKSCKGAHRGRSGLTAPR